MAEYIEREALLGIFDATISHLRDRAGGDGILLASIGLVQNSRDLVAKFPTADVVEVVRCKNCQHWGGVTFGFVCRKFSGIETKICMGADQYCSYGEAKMDGKGENDD